MKIYITHLFHITRRINVIENAKIKDGWAVFKTVNTTNCIPKSHWHKTQKAAFNAIRKQLVVKYIE